MINEYDRYRREALEWYQARLHFLKCGLSEDSLAVQVAHSEARDALHKARIIYELLNQN